MVFQLKINSFEFIFFEQNLLQNLHTRKRRFPFWSQPLDVVQPIPLQNESGFRYADQGGPAPACFRKLVFMLRFVVKTISWSKCTRVPFTGYGQTPAIRISKPTRKEIFTQGLPSKAKKSHSWLFVTILGCKKSFQSMRKYVELCKHSMPLCLFLKSL